MRYAILCVSIFLAMATGAGAPADITHHIAAIEQDKFHGWPANNGAWHWGEEILVGLTRGDYVSREGHNLTGIQHSVFARSLDGGASWSVFDPKNFLDDDNEKWLPVGKKRLETPLVFSDPGFAMRVFATGYHGNEDPEAGFYYSYDRGATWEGPWFLGDIHRHPELKGMELNPRTDYIVLGPRDCLLFITANARGDLRGCRIACIRTTDGGLNFEFVSWMTPETEEYRAVMPSTVRLAGERLLSTFRKIYVDKSILESTIDAYLSEDGGKTWQYRSTVKKIAENSNPPATVRLADGRLCCIYGDRDAEVMAGKYSGDDGKTWGDEFEIRSCYQSTDGWADMGYPRLVQRPDGKLVAMYYWADAENPQQYIAASIWTP